MNLLALTLPLATLAIAYIFCSSGLAQTSNPVKLEPLAERTSPSISARPKWALVLHGKPPHTRP